MYIFPQRLQELMKEFNLTQVQLSIDTNIPQPTIARWLANICKPTIENFISLAKYFKCSIDYLVGLVD